MPTTETPASAGLQGSKTARIAAWGLAVGIVVLSLVPPTMRPQTGASNSLEHFIIYVAIGFAFGLGYKRRHYLLAIFLVIFSGLIEVAQLLVPGRHARLSDFITDALAACVGLVTLSLFSLARGRTR